MWWVELRETLSEQVESSETDKPLHRGGQKLYRLARIRCDGPHSLNMLFIAISRKSERVAYHLELRFRISVKFWSKCDEIRLINLINSTWRQKENSRPDRY